MRVSLHFRHLIVAGLALGLAVTPALAYKLITKGAAVVAGKSITVTPGCDWNRIGFVHGKIAESWTLDGLALNDVTFYGGIPADTVLIRETNKKDKPLPRFSPTMLAPDVAQLFEGSYRLAKGTSLFSIDSVEPAQFAGRPGFRFAYTFTVQNEEVKRKGEATGAIVGGKLYMITFEAPVIHYFDRDAPQYRAIVDSAKI